jgi:hypothetical protein
MCRRKFTCVFLTRNDQLGDEKLLKLISNKKGISLVEANSFSHWI